MGCKLFTYLLLEHFRCYWVFEFLRVKSDARALREVFGFQLQPDGCKHKLMIASIVGTWERLCVRIVEAGKDYTRAKHKIGMIAS